MGQMEMECIFDIGKIFLYGPRFSQVSDVAHGPLFFFLTVFNIDNFISTFSFHIVNSDVYIILSSDEPCCVMVCELI
jgi:hypothetical protein